MKEIEKFEFSPSEGNTYVNGSGECKAASHSLGTAKEEGTKNRKSRWNFKHLLMVIMLSAFFGNGTAWGQLLGVGINFDKQYAKYHYYPGYNGSPSNFGIYSGVDQFGKNGIYCDFGFAPDSVCYGVVTSIPGSPAPGNEKDAYTLQSGTIYRLTDFESSWDGKTIRIFAKYQSTIFTCYILNFVGHPQIISPSTNTAYCAGKPIAVDVSRNSSQAASVKYNYVQSYDTSNNYSYGYTISANSSTATNSDYTITPTQGPWIKIVAQNTNGEWGTPICLPISIPPTAPTSIAFSNNPICSGSSVTLTALGGSTGDGCTYQWGTGSTCGNNTISGTDSSITISPTLTTTYWVRRIGISPCKDTTNCASVTITVNPNTSISYHPTIVTPPSLCQDSANFPTLSVTASGLNLSYQWYRNTVNSNIGGTLISGATNATYTPPSSITPGDYYYYCVVTGTCGTVISSVSGMHTILPNTTISSQPSTTARNMCFDSGNFPTLSVTTGGLNLSYQWYRNTTNSNTGGSAISGATTSSYIPPSNLTPGNYYYYCIVVGTCGTAKSNVSGVHTINAITAITSQPSTTAQTLCFNTGNFQPLSVTATGASLTYAWYRNQTGLHTGGTQVSTNNTYTPSSNLTAGDYYYYCVVTGICGTDTSIVSGKHTVNPSTVISSQPSTTAQTLCYDSGNFSTLSITATGMNLSYQWYRNTTSNTTNGTLIVGATNSTYTPPSNLPPGNYYYYCVVTGACGNVTSYASGVHTIIPNTSISSQPSTTAQSMCYNMGYFPTLSVTAIGANLSYEWYRNQTGLASGGTQVSTGGNVYTPSSNLTPGDYYYYCVVTGICGTDISNVSGRHTIKHTTIVSQPSTIAQTLCHNGGNFPTLSVTAIGENLTYVWYRNQTGLTSGGTQVSNSGNTYTPSSNIAPGNYYYYCVAIGTCWTDTSDVSGMHTIDIPPTAPTSISYSNNPICLHHSTTLTAIGGSEGSGNGTGCSSSSSCAYEWGTGDTCGNNIIFGQKNSSIIVNPDTATTYWVRRVGTSACTNVTACATEIVTIYPPVPATHYSAIFCQGSTYSDANFTGLTNEGRYTNTLENRNGCDSIVILHLYYYPYVQTTYYYAKICQGSSYSDDNFDGLTQEGQYFNTLRNINGCDSIVSVYISYYPSIPISYYSASFCQGQDTYYTDDNFEVLTQPGIYYATLMNINGCDSIVCLTLSYSPIPNTYYYRTICKGDVYNDDNFSNKTMANIWYSNTLQTDDGCDSMVWLMLDYYPTDTTNYSGFLCQEGDYSDDNFTNLNQEGVYYVILENINGCDSVVCLHLSYLIPSAPQLCMVSTNEENNNEIIWHEQTGAISYKIYREGMQGGQYDLIGTTNGLKWTDTDCKPNYRSYRYKISYIDDCGNESELSNDHKTMHLTIDNSCNLLWTAYEGINYATYYIYRAQKDTNGLIGAWELIEKLPNGTTLYSDLSVTAGHFYYKIAINIDDACAPKSNIAKCIPDLSINEIDAETSKINVYPNPTKNELFIKSDLQIEKVEIYTIIGCLVLSENNVKDKISVSDLPEGFYLLKVYTDNGLVVRKFVKD